MAKFDTQLAIKHLRAKWGEDRPCPMCRVSAWTVTDSTAEIREIPGSSALATAGNMSVVIVTCGNCGNTILLNSGVLGLVHGPIAGR